MANIFPFTDHGLLLVDKPVGASSAFVVARLKKLLRAKKVGHTGTLDPFAGGLLICGINHGTRLSRFFLEGDKTYRSRLTFGVETDTLDSTGTVIRSCEEMFFKERPDFFTRETIDALLQSFAGPQMQIPPVYSALKHEGVPLYKLARKGTPVQKEARPIVIRSISLLTIEPPDITFDVTCSTGTYIRSLACDIGNAAGCGAHLSGLLRTESGGFSLDSAHTLDALADSGDISSSLISMDDALPCFPAVTADSTLKKRILNGGTLTPADLSADHIFGSPFIKIRDEDRNLIAVIEFDKTRSGYNYCCVFHD